MKVIYLTDREDGDGDDEEEGEYHPEDCCQLEEVVWTNVQSDEWSEPMLKVMQMCWCNSP